MASPERTAGTTARFMRLCLQTRWRPDALTDARALRAEGRVHWEDLVRMARLGGVAPLLYHATRDEDLVPAYVERELRVVYYATAQRNVRLFDELEDVVARLAALDVPVILLKGSALAEQVYDNLAVRPMGDLDLLVRERDVPAALGVLHDAGYEVVPPRAYRCEVTVCRPGHTAAPIEIHWNLFVPFFYQFTLSTAWFWETSLPLPGDRVGARTLGPEAQVLHLCGHILLHHPDYEAPRPLWLCDVASVIGRYERAIDWDALLRQARISHLILPLQRILPLLWDQWQAPIPAGVVTAVEALTPSPVERRMVARPPSRGPEERLWRGLSDLPDWATRFRCVWRNVFPPRGYMAHVYGAAHPTLLPVYYARRWLHVLRSMAAQGFHFP